MDIHGNAAARVGQIVELYNPQQGVGTEGINRFFVHGVSQSNEGTPSTSVIVREVIGSRGLRNVTLRDVLAANNNAMNMNPDIDDFELVDGVYLPAGYVPRGGVNVRYTTSLNGSGNGMLMTGTGSTSYNSGVRLRPFPDGVGRFGYPYGQHFLFTINVTALTNCAPGIFVEGWPTTGNMTKVITSKGVKISEGRTRDVTLKGRFLTDSNIPEMELTVRALKFSDRSLGAPSSEQFVVNSVFFRSSQNEEDIYPLHGGEKFRSY